MNIDRLEFELDLNGFAIERNFLPRSLTDRMNAIIENSNLLADVPKFLFADCDDTFFSLIFNESVLALCDRWIDPHFRFDHAWGVHYPPNVHIKPDNLHAGPFQNHGFFQYGWYNSRPKVSCLLFSYILKDQPKGCGGILLLPGSHKLNFPINTHASRDVLQTLYSSRIDSIPTLYSPELKQGDLLIMAEATVHGTSQWSSKHEWRRNIYYKYCYGGMGWVPQDDPASAKLRALAKTEIQRRVLEVPYVARLPGTGQEWRKVTFQRSGNKLQSDI